MLKSQNAVCAKDLFRGPDSVRTAILLHFPVIAVHLPLPYQSLLYQSTEMFAGSGKSPSSLRTLDQTKSDSKVMIGICVADKKPFIGDPRFSKLTNER